jgi:hypothetical protein
VLKNADEILDKIYETIELRGKHFAITELRKGAASFYCPNSLGLQDFSQDCSEGYEHSCYKCWENAL